MRRQTLDAEIAALIDAEGSPLDATPFERPRVPTPQRPDPADPVQLSLDWGTAFAGVLEREDDLR